MIDIKALKAEKLQIEATLAEKVKAYGGDDDMTPEQADEINSLVARHEEIVSTLDQAEKSALAKAKAQAIASAPKLPKSQPIPTGFAYDNIQPVGPAWENDPKKGYSSTAGFFLDVMQGSKSGRFSEQLQYLSTAGSDEAGTHSDPYGGFLIPKALLPGVMSVPNEMDPTESRVTRIPMESQIVNIPARVDKNHTSSVSGGLQVYRREETGALTSTRQQFEMIELKLNWLGGISYATEELLTYSPSSFVAMLEQGFQQEFVAKNLKERLSGSGVGQRLGVLNSGNGSLVSITRNGGSNNIDGVDLIAMRARAWNYNNAIWIANHDCLPNLMSAHLAGTNSDIAVWTSSLQDGVPDRIMNRPVFFSEFMPTVAAAGSILLADWSQYLEATKGGVEMAESIHVRFENHERAFKFWTYNTGAPWWRSALTPNKGSNTLSPFVTLAAA